MKRNVYIMLILLFSSRSASCQDPDTCNRKCRLKSLSAKLPKGFCLSKGKWVTQIIDTVDLTGDKQGDLIAEWRSEKFYEGDTVRITIFAQNADHTFSQVITFDNLYTPQFTDYASDLKTGNQRLDSVYWRYIYSNDQLVEFKDQTIVVGFFLDAGSGVDFYFTYRRDLRDWLLSMKKYWVQYNKIIGKEIIEERAVDDQISLKRFKIIDFLN